MIRVSASHSWPESQTKAEGAGGEVGRDLDDVVDELGADVCGLHSLIWSISHGPWITSAYPGSVLLHVQW